MDSNTNELHWNNLVTIQSDDIPVTLAKPFARAPTPSARRRAMELRQHFCARAYYGCNPDPHLSDRCPDHLRLAVQDRGQAGQQGQLTRILPSRATIATHNHPQCGESLRSLLELRARSKYYSSGV